jgi:serine protease AprX
MRSRISSIFLVGLTFGGLLAASAPASAEVVHVVIGHRSGTEKAVNRLIRQAGGTVNRQLAAIDMAVADVPASALPLLARNRDITSISTDHVVGLHVSSNGKGRGQADANNSAIDVDGPRGRGLNGSGVDVAIIDSGVSPVAGLAGRIIDSPDFSADASLPNLAALDSFGHGTHLAGLIAGNDPATGFTGVAPASRIVNVKVAAHDGTTTVESLLSGINWVILNSGPKSGLNIRVLNLSLGLDAEGGYIGDPLTQAVEKAWQKDIVVVVSAGNGGAATTSLQSPAVSPFVIAVAAEDTKGTATKADDTMADFSNNGSGTRNPDVTAPGVGMVSLRVPGSALDEAFPDARIDDTLFRGNGTSQAAAIVSGAAALIVQANPKITPDQVKALLMNTATPIPGVSVSRQGSGRVSVAGSVGVYPPDAKSVAQKWETAGKIDLKKLDKLNGKAKGGKSSKSLEAEALTGNRWSGNRWSGNRWSGNRWSGSGWA